MVVADTHDFGVAPIQCLGHILPERRRRSLYLYTLLATSSLTASEISVSQSIKVPQQWKVMKLKSFRPRGLKGKTIRASDAADSSRG